jgi:hypothetical protein
MLAASGRIALWSAQALALEKGIVFRVPRAVQ